MSIHKSLKQKNSLVGTRSVLTRWERIVKLKDDGRWKEGDKVLGLPKVRTWWRQRKRKKEEAVPGAPGAAPAAGAKAAPGAKPAAGAAAAGGAKAAPAAGAKAAPAAAAPKKK